MQQLDTYELHACPVVVRADVLSDGADVSSLAVSLSHGGGSSEVGEEFEAEAHHKVPDVSGHLGSGDEDSPDDHRQDCIEGVTNVPQPRVQTPDTSVTLKSLHFG